jgi:transposase
MARGHRIDTQRLDLSGFEAWLRSQLTGSALAAVVVVIMQIVRALFEQNTQLRSRILGRRLKPPSERLSALERQIAFQFTLPVNDVAPSAAAPASVDDAKANASEPKSNRSSRTRKPLPKHIASVAVRNDVPANERSCENCDVIMNTVGHRRGGMTFELKPATIEQHVRYDETIACPKCDAIRTAKAPPALLDGGLLGPTLVTESLASKILDAMPVERQARNYQRQGVPVSASTLGRSIGAALDLLGPLAARVMERVKQSTHVQLDSTGLRVLDPDTPLGTHRDTLWVLVGDEKWVSFAALESGDANAIEELIRGADADTWQCDGTSTTNFVEKKWRRCRPGCHAHARRKLAEAVRRGDLRALELLRLYAKLFSIEKVATKDGVDAAERQRRREAQSVPILEQMSAWVLATAPGVEPKSPLGEALTYLQRQWMRLWLFVLCGEIEITNNRSERELRPWVLGQHAWLFVGDQPNAERWAAGFTVAHTALAHGLNPRAYLHAVLQKLIAGHSHTRLDELLPDAMLRTEPGLADPLRARDTGNTSIPDPRAA